MAKIIVFSDLHAHPFEPYSQILPSGINSRLQDALDVLTQIRKYAIEHDINTVLFGGDLFYERKHVPTQTLNLVKDYLDEFAGAGIHIYMLAGNHDQYDAAGIWDSVTLFDNEYITVWGQGLQSIDEIDLDVLAIPYIEDVEELRGEIANPCVELSDRPIIFLGHLGLNDAMASTDFVYRNPVELSLKDLRPERFDAGFLGHFHMCQNLGQNFHYIGAPMHHNWSDKNQCRGFLVYDTETKVVEQEFVDAPKFIEVEDIWNPPEPLKGHYVRIFDEEKWTNQRKEAVKAEHGMRTLEVVKPKRTKPKQHPRIVIDPKFSYYEVITKSIQSGLMDVGDLDPDQLVTLGHDIIKEVESGK